MTATMPGPCETVRVGQNIFVRAAKVRGGFVTPARERGEGEPVVLRRKRYEIGDVELAAPRRVKRPA